MVGGYVSEEITKTQMSMVCHEWNLVAVVLLVQQHSLLFRTRKSVQLPMRYTTRLIQRDSKSGSQSSQ